MSRTFPRAEDLNHEELDFELQIRNEPEEVFKLDLTAKQRHLRNLFKNDQKEGRNYQSPFNIFDEYSHIEGRIENLEKALEKRVESKYESRVLHYWYRVKWIQVVGEEEKRKKRELVQAIERIMAKFQFGPPQSPTISKINSILQGGADQAVGRQGQSALGSQTSSKSLDENFSNQFEMHKGAFVGTPTRSLGAIPKSAMNEVKDRNTLCETRVEGLRNDSDRSTHISITRKEWEEMQSVIADLAAKLAQSEALRQQTHGREQDNRGRESPAPQRNEAPPRTEINRNRRTTNSYQGSVEDDDSEDDVRRPQPVWDNRHFQISGRDSDYSYGNGWNNYANQAGLRQPVGRYAGQGRVEKWKLRFTGEPRSTMTVETFLYKAKKLAEREGVARHILLRDVHMLLEGAASDWFFTFVDDLNTWEDFETSISYRFGNPNKDQGIRTKIQERKQQRGEPFIAFVTEIEKMNRLLSKPLSNRRKFEVIWDNMRQHYRSKISIVEVKDLQQLTQLNYRIDAADPQLQSQGSELTTGFQRRPINQLDADGSDYESDQSINAINTRSANNFSRANRSSAEQTTRTAQNGSTPASCWNCQGQGHTWRQCTRPRVIFCYGCGNLGRTIRSCERCSRTPTTQVSNQGNEQ